MYDYIGRNSNRNNLCHTKFTNQLNKNGNSTKLQRSLERDIL